MSSSVFFPPFEIEIGKNPRTLKNPGFLAEQMCSLQSGIQRDGLIHALLVRIVKGKPRLIAGERRLRSIMALLQRDAQTTDAGGERVMCFNPRTGKTEPASEVYNEVECKVTDCPDDREARRKAIQENTLHENLTDYELLLQVDEMENDGFSRAEQAETMAMSEAWISQSHSLLAAHPKIAEYMEQGKLTRTAAITFLNIPDDKVEAVLDRAVQMTYEEAEKKEYLALKEREQALEELEEAGDTITVSQFTGNQSQAKKARRVANRANKAIAKADKKLASARKKKNKKVTVETIASAAREIDGAGDEIKRPYPAKAIRQIVTDLGELLKKDGDGPLVNPESKLAYDREHVRILHDAFNWALNQTKAKHPIEILVALDSKKKK